MLETIGTIKRATLLKDRGALKSWKKYEIKAITIIMQKYKLGLLLFAL